jgi:hypothetical protein
MVSNFGMHTADQTSRGLGNMNLDGKYPTQVQVFAGATGGIRRRLPVQAGTSAELTASLLLGAAIQS